MTKRTTAKIAKLAARILDGGKYSKQDVLALAGSALAQAERDEGAVKRWMLEYPDGQLAWMTYGTEKSAKHINLNAVPVEILRIGKAKRRK